MIGTNHDPRLRETYLGKRVLVTGGFGFIGSHVTHELVELGAQVTVLDQSTRPGRESLINLEEFGLRSRITHTEGSVADSALMRQLAGTGVYEHIFHFAAHASVIEKAVADPLATVQANTMGLVNLLEAVRQAPRQPDCIVHASTDKVYGDADGEPYDEGKTALRGLGVYDSTKLAADVFARMYHEVFGLPTVVLRLCNIFGPHDFNTGYRLVPRSMRRLYDGDEPAPPELYAESKDHYRDYLYIDDCVRAILVVGACPECRGEVFNLMGCCHLSTPEMCRCMVRIGEQVAREDDPQRADLIRRNDVAMTVSGQQSDVLTIGDQRSTGEKLRRATGFAPVISLEEGLCRTARAYRDYFRRQGGRRNGQSAANGRPSVTSLTPVDAPKLT